MAQCGFAARATSIKKYMSRSFIQADSGTNLIKQGGGEGGNVKGRPSGQVSWQTGKVSHGKREALVRVPVGLRIFLPCDIWWFSVGSRLGQQALKSACLVVPSFFRGKIGDESN